MASTNKTTVFELSQFIGTDKPSWLGDYNSDMSKIDHALDHATTDAEDAVRIAEGAALAVAGKQDALIFDDAPVYGSNNPVKSGGIYNAITNIHVNVDSYPTEGSTDAVSSGGVFTALSTKQDTLTFDEAPTANSTNPVTSGGVYAAINGGGSVTWNNVSGSGTPKFRASRVGDVIVCTTRDVALSATTSWTLATDNTFPSVQKKFYCSGNPFNLPVNTTFPLTQSAMLNVVGGMGMVKMTDTSGNFKQTIYARLIYVASENRTYFYLQTNNPPSATALSTEDSTFNLAI